ncbi:hypothetical protein I543_1088 [Mycobacteroides abscessus 21]|uniref:Uncharacterized protein n=1 Tax=Mycobacteroides abscessus 21 TaxID=1299324 RepID=A0A829PZP6_9MYCO|nr:hypothetical protein I543_1088 [Mycobacteroides abscessus 21]
MTTTRGSASGAAAWPATLALTRASLLLAIAARQLWFSALARQTV